MDYFNYLVVSQDDIDEQPVAAFVVLIDAKFFVRQANEFQKEHYSDQRWVIIDKDKTILLEDEAT